MAEIASYAVFGPQYPSSNQSCFVCFHFLLYMSVRLTLSIFLRQFIQIHSVSFLGFFSQSTFQCCRPIEKYNQNERSIDFKCRSKIRYYQHFQQTTPIYDKCIYIWDFLVTNKLRAWRHNMPPPLQADNIFSFIRQVAVLFRHNNIFLFTHVACSDMLAI